MSFEIALSTKWLIVLCLDCASVYIRGGVFDTEPQMQVLYENIVCPNEHIQVQYLIDLSEKCRGGNNLEYADAVADLIARLKLPGAKISKQHMFRWDWLGLESPCFRFEYHRALFAAFAEAQMEASANMSDSDYAKAAACYQKAATAAKKAANNLLKWTAVCPELVRYPPFHLNYILAMVADAKCHQAKALFSEGYTNIAGWKCGVVKLEITRALANVKSACKWAALANVLWARPDGQGGMTSSPDELERELTQQFYRVSTYAASTFQERLDYASLCTEFEDMQSIVDLNTKLYYLTPKPVKATSVATLDDLCRA